ncbi:MAG: transcriptional repressor LexA [Dehalococcoidia bacterium]
MKQLSARQQRMLQFIGEFVDERGYPPTVRDIQYACDISSTSVVDYNLNILQREGRIRRSPEISRGIEILDGARRRSDTLTVPMLGYIAAGQPLPVLASEDWSQEDPLDTLEIPKGKFKGQEGLFALGVRGTSMIDALIDDGDVVVIKKTTEVRDGDMVVAWLKKEKEATLKRLFHEGNRIRLQPANSQMDPIYVDPENLEVQGKVVAVFRDLS